MQKNLLIFGNVSLRIAFWVSEVNGLEEKGNCKERGWGWLRPVGLVYLGGGTYFFILRINLLWILPCKNIETNQNKIYPPHYEHLFTCTIWGSRFASGLWKSKLTGVGRPPGDERTDPASLSDAIGADGSCCCCCDGGPSVVSSFEVSQPSESSIRRSLPPASSETS